MDECYQRGFVYTSDRLVEQRIIRIAKSYHMCLDTDERYLWDSGGWPSNLGERISRKSITNIEDVYNALVKNEGPLYAYYSITKNNETSYHLVLVTGADCRKGVVYTNNPWGCSGEQSFTGFLNSIVCTDGTNDYDCSLICLYETEGY